MRNREVDRLSGPLAEPGHDRLRGAYEGVDRVVSCGVRGEHRTGPEGAVVIALQQVMALQCVEHARGRRAGQSGLVDEVTEGRWLVGMHHQRQQLCRTVDGLRAVAQGPTPTSRRGAPILWNPSPT